MSNLKVHVMILNILNSRLKKSEFPISLVREAFRVEPDHRLPVPERDVLGERREVGGQDKTSEGEIRILQLTISPELYLNSSMKNPFNKNLSTASEISLSAEDLI